MRNSLSRRSVVRGITTLGTLPSICIATFPSRAQEPSSFRLVTRCLILGQTGHGKSTLAAALSHEFGDGAAVGDIERRASENLELHGLGCAPLTLLIQGRIQIIGDCTGSGTHEQGLESGRIRPDCAILVVSASDGPMPGTRNHIALARRHNIPFAAVFLNKIDQVDDRELTELVTYETEELLETEGYAASMVPFVVGSALSAALGRNKEIGR